MCANCGMHTRSSKLVIICFLSSRNVGWRRGRGSMTISAPPPATSMRVPKKKLTLSPTLTELTNGMAEIPKMEATAKEARLQKCMIVFVAPRQVIYDNLLILVEIDGVDRPSARPRMLTRFRWMCGKQGQLNAGGCPRPGEDRRIKIIRAVQILFVHTVKFGVFVF